MPSFMIPVILVLIFMHILICFFKNSIYMAVKIQGNMDKYHVKPEHIILEITESAVIRDKGRGDSIIHQLNNAGFEYASDDCGTGQANYSYVHEFPFSIIKIDNRSLWAAEKIPLIVPFSRICSGW